MPHILHSHVFALYFVFLQPVKASLAPDRSNRSYCRPEASHSKRQATEIKEKEKMIGVHVSFCRKTYIIHVIALGAEKYIFVQEIGFKAIFSVPGNSVMTENYIKHGSNLTCSASILSEDEKL